ncbi:discoidin domain-containing protein [Streptomyces sp. PKU-EA00015]|uniref:galactose-binding domain-containing protein n=1 Tax=Streptomyces sp. PKU-EA00015 TaxID=2748326 RepID=UPI00210C1661|nr:discoidin domain-containing protein [Streptomyces sp. PKU-EA00015]
MRGGRHLVVDRAEFTRLGGAGAILEAGTKDSSVVRSAARAVDGDTTTDTRTLSEPGAWWQVDLGSTRQVEQVEVWNNSSMTTAGFDVVTDTGTVHVPGKALRPTLIDLDTETRFVRIRLTGTGPVALSHVLVHP